jgi:hypothetical protein
MSKPLPPPLPPAERTVGQVIAESIRLYGQRFWAALLLGLPIAAITQLSAGHSLGTQTIILWIASPFVTAAYVWAIVIAAPARPPRGALVRAYVVGLVVFLPVPALLRLYVLPALAWLALFGLSVARRRVRAARLSERARPWTPARRGRLRPRAWLALRGVDRLLHHPRDAPAAPAGQADTAERVAAFLADLVISPCCSSARRSSTSTRRLAS